MEEKGSKAQKNLWGAAILVQFHLHDSEITSLPPPSPVSILAPRFGYLPLIAPQLKASFSSTLPPGDDTVWFEYKGMPLKWYIPTGVLFDLLCAEPECPWKLTVHFRGYPNNVLIPCEGEDAVKWNFINSLKEEARTRFFGQHVSVRHVLDMRHVQPSFGQAAYIMNGNCHNIMNMSQSDQSALWRSCLDGNLDCFLNVTSKLKLGVVKDKYINHPTYKPLIAAGNLGDTDLVKTGKIPVRLYVRTTREVFQDLESMPEIDSWERVSFINRPIEFDKAEGTYMTFGDAMKTLLPEYFRGTEEEINNESSEDPVGTALAGEATTTTTDDTESIQPTANLKIGLIRIHRCELPLKAPLSWVVNNLMAPDHYLHICVYLVHQESTFRQLLTTRC